MGRSSTDLVGQTVDDKFLLEAYLGGGGMGDVYRAKHLRVGRHFAIKVLHPHLTSDPKIVARFEREAQIAAKLRHPNVVPVLDIGDDDGRCYLVMELAAGDSLAELLDSEGFSRERALRIIGQLCDGLAYAHELGLVHRDLKPDNVIIERTGNGDVARIVDFGVALLREGGDASTGRLTTAGVVLGSPQYVAPEVAVGGTPDRRADLFALGIICFELLTGHLPFEGRGVDAVHANVFTATPAFGVRVPGLAVDPLLEAFTRKLMEKQPEARPASAADARALLDLIERDPDAAAEALGIAPPPPPPVRPSRHTLPLAAGAALAVAIGAFVLVTSGAPEPQTAVVAAVAVPAPAVTATPAAMPVPAPAPVPPPRPAPPKAITTPRPKPIMPAVAPTPKPAREPLGLASCSDTTPPRPPPTPNVLVSRYVAIGRELKRRGDAEEIDRLRQRYSLIQIQRALLDEPERKQTVAILDDIQRQLDRPTP
jgi:hypothetical protein